MKIRKKLILVPFTFVLASCTPSGSPSSGPSVSLNNNAGASHTQTQPGTIAGSKDSSASSASPSPQDAKYIYPLSFVRHVRFVGYASDRSSEWNISHKRGETSVIFQGKSYNVGELDGGIAVDSVGELNHALSEQVISAPGYQIGAGPRLEHYATSANNQILVYGDEKLQKLYFFDLKQMKFISVVNFAGEQDIELIRSYFLEPYSGFEPALEYHFDRENNADEFHRSARVLAAAFAMRINANGSYLAYSKDGVIYNLVEVATGTTIQRKVSVDPSSMEHSGFQRLTEFGPLPYFVSTTGAVEMTDSQWIHFRAKEFADDGPAFVPAYNPATANNSPFKPFLGCRFSDGRASHHIVDCLSPYYGDNVWQFANGSLVYHHTNPPGDGYQIYDPIQQRTFDLSSPAEIENNADRLNLYPPAYGKHEFGFWSDVGYIVLVDNPDAPFSSGSSVARTTTRVHMVIFDILTSEQSEQTLVLDSNHYATCAPKGGPGADQRQLVCVQK